MIDLHTATIVTRTYQEDNDSDVDALVEVEVEEGEVRMITFPRQIIAQTFSMSVEEAWRLSRELAKAATVVELGLDD